MVVYLQNIIVVKAVYIKFFTKIHVMTYNFIEESDTHLGSAVASSPKWPDFMLLCGYTWYQVKKKPPWEVDTAEWVLMPFKAATNLDQNRCSYKRYNFKVYYM